MIRREDLGVVEPLEGWPRLSIPRPVEDYYYRLIKQWPADVSATVVGHGYHNQGWSYLEVEVSAISLSKACEYAERLGREITWEFQLRNMQEA